MELSEKTKEILERIKADDRERYEKMLPYLQNIVSIRRSSYIMTGIASVMNLVMCMLLAMSGSPMIVFMFMIVHSIAFYAGLLVNKRDEDKCWDALKDLDFPFDEFKEQSE